MAFEGEGRVRGKKGRIVLKVKKLSEGKKGESKREEEEAGTGKAYIEGEKMTDRKTDRWASK